MAFVGLLKEKRTGCELRKWLIKAYRGWTNNDFLILTGKKSKSIEKKGCDFCVMKFTNQNSRVNILRNSGPEKR